MLSTSQYDPFDTSGKSPAWLSALPCPVLRLDGSRLLSELVAEILGAIDG
jgi:hypothetical protein